MGACGDRDERLLEVVHEVGCRLDPDGEPDEVRRLARIVIVTRPGSGKPAKTSDIVCERPTPDISGSALRRAIAKREPLGDRVQESVARYIAENGLYGDNRHIGR